MPTSDPKINLLDDLKNKPDDKIEAIKQILPDCFDSDGNLIGEKLHEVLTGNFEKPELERFTFNWAGKQKAREVAYQSYIDGTLKFDIARSKNFDTTKNLIIEGDNLQVLKLLKYSYKSKVKCIYIDPPYNTGSDFVYNDSFELDIKKYLIETGEIDEETGEQMADYIQKDDGKKHSKWLSFMYPRLMMAKELLKEDGVIFVSIDDNEVHNLRQLMNEVFGEGNFIGQLVWRKKYGGGKGSQFFVDLHEYVLVYAKDIQIINGFSIERTEEKAKIFELEDEFIKTRGKYYIRPLKSGLALRKTLIYGIECPDESIVETQWICAKDTFETWKDEGRIVFKKLEDGKYNVYKKFYEKDGGGLILPESIIFDMTYNQNGKEELKKIFEIKEGREVYFDNAKPVDLVKHFINISTQPNDLILDFFAGSGTTGQAVMELNQEEIDKQTKQNEGVFENDEQKAVGGRKFILVQLPEKIDDKKEAAKAGYKKISDITIERVKRAGEKYKSVDNGFKVLELTDNPNRDDLWSLNNLPDDENSNQFVLTHLALMYGYGLNYEAIKISEKEIYIMKPEIPKTKDAIVILEKDPLTMTDIMNLVKKYSEGSYKFFSRDSSLNIELTHNLLQHFREDNVVVF